MEIHDHFSGSAHCVDCGGNCRLSGDDLALTRLIRYVFEFAEYSHDGWMWDFTTEALRDLLKKRFETFKKRASEEVSLLRVRK